ncbi:hypothetical protein D3C81_1810110 [compost metagenome]
MAGGMPSQQVVRQGEAAVGLHSPGVLDPQRRKKAQHLVIIIAERIGHAPYRIPGDVLQVLAVLQNLFGNAFAGGHGKKGMSAGMCGNFMPLIEGCHFFPGDIAVLAKKARIQMEGAFQPMLIQRRYQPSVVDSAIIPA